MRTKQNKERHLSVQNLEARKLFAADVGFGDMTTGQETPAEVGRFRPGKVQRPTFGPLDNGCPSCDFEHHAESCITPETTDSTARTYRKANFTITIEPVNDTPFRFESNAEQIAGPAD